VRIVVGAAWLAALAGCDNTVVIRPIIDHPTGDLNPFTKIDHIELSIAIAGEPTDLANAGFSEGQTLELPAAPYGVNLVVHMLGIDRGSKFAYGRTCPFDIQPGDPDPQPHLYFGGMVAWAPAAQPPSGLRSGGTAVSYRSSGIFIGGLDTAAAPVVGVDRFDALNGRFDNVVNLAPRRFGNASIVGIGRVVIAGGFDPGGQPISRLEVVNIDQQTVEQADAGPLLGINASAFTTLGDGKVVSFGGRDAANVPVRDLVEITATGDSATLRVLRPKLATARYGHTATAMSEDIGAPVLIAGGRDGASNVVDTAELYKPLQEELASPAEFAPKMVVPRSGHQGVRLPDGSVLIVGGLDRDNKAVLTVEQFSLDRGFRAVATLPATAGITDFTATPLPDGRVLLAGGRDDANNQVDTAFIARLDTTGGGGIQILTTTVLETPRYGHQATLLCDGTVMLTGGTIVEAPAERYNPPEDGRR
jgi:hypothetical protein